MGDMKDHFAKAIRIILTLAVIGGLFYLAYEQMGLILEYSAGLAIVIGLLFYAIMSNYDSPEKVKKIFRFIFAAGGAVLIGWLGRNLGYELEYYVGMGIVIFIILIVLLNKGKSAGKED